MKMKRNGLPVLILFFLFGFALISEAAEKWSGSGMLLTEPGQVPILFLRGNPAEMGRAHGELLKPEIQEMFNRILLVAGAYMYTKNDWFPDRISEVEQRSGKFTPPRFLEEADAMSRAAGLTVPEGRALNFFPEMFHCSGIALHGKATVGGRVLHARVLDYMRDIGLQKFAVIQVFMPEKYNTWVSFGFAGLNGTVTAMNIEGLAIGEMGGRGEGKWDGLPMSYLMRRVMEECRNVEEALKIIRETPLTCEYYYVLSDRSGNMAAIEARAGSPPVVLRPNEKHPLLPAAYEDVVYVSGGARASHLSNRIRDHYGKFTPELLREIIRRPVAMKSNLQNVIFQPETLDADFAYAGKTSPACDEPYTRINLRKLVEYYRDARTKHLQAPESSASRTSPAKK